MRHLIRETDAGPIDFHWFHMSHLGSFSFLQILILQELKMRHLNKSCETNEGKIKEQDHRPKIPH